jgi:hypothetical protein
MRTYIFATVAALLMAAPALAQPTTPGVSGGTEPNPQSTGTYNSPTNPEQAQVPPGGKPYSEELNQGSKAGPMREQPNQNNRDINRSDTNMPHTYGSPARPQ